MNWKSSHHRFFCVFVVLFVLFVMGSMTIQHTDTISSHVSIDSLPSTQEDLTYLQWDTSWGSNNIDYAEDIWADENYIFVCGTFDANTSYPVLSLTKYSKISREGQEWNHTWTDGSPIYGNAVWGNSSFIYTAGTSVNKLVLIKWDYDGYEIWNKTWSLNSNFGEVHSLFGMNNSLYLSGVYIDDMLLMKFDEDGNEIWNRTWGGSAWEEGFDVWGDGYYLYSCGMRNLPK